MGPMMLLAHARVACSPTDSVRRNVQLRGARISFTRACGDAVDLSGYLLLPGLINAHDHLEFNLFPRLGRRIYANAVDWAGDIHRPKESPVREHLSLAKRDRLIWGGLRNLLNGVTTVAHHNPYQPIFDEGFPVRVVRRFGWAHSIAFAHDVAARYRETPPDQPFLIHAAEGTDACARAEIGKLDRWGVLDRRTVLVHALGIDRSGLERIQKRGCSMVWCPSSNLLTYGRTLACDFVRESCCALGTDSAISAAGDMTDEIRIAHSQGASIELLYDMVTHRAAKILRLGQAAGAIRHGAVADFIAVRDLGQTPAEALLQLTPELVIIGGRVRLISKPLRSRFAIKEKLHSIALEGRGEWFTPFDVPRLLNSARAALGPEIRLAGKRVLE